MFDARPFAVMDEARRGLGWALELAGIGPEEQPSRAVAALEGASLRAYHPRRPAPRQALLIVPAPFKRRYVWDLLPPVSVVRAAAAAGFGVYLIDWQRPSPAEDELGLSVFAEAAPAAAVAAVEADCGCAAPIVAGHSLGATLAAIFAALRPELVGGLVLADGPLAFGPLGGPLAAAVAAMPHASALRALAGSPVPGTFLNALCVGADPADFVAQRAADSIASLRDSLAAAIHARIVRWTLDEFPLPGRLFEEVLEDLYRADRFLSGDLAVNGRTVGLKDLRAPTLAVANAASAVVPPQSVLAGLEASQAASKAVLTYPGDCGPLLQHLGPLVAPYAHARLWPAIFHWMETQAAA